MNPNLVAVRLCAANWISSKIKFKFNYLEETELNSPNI